MNDNITPELKEAFANMLEDAHVSIAGSMRDRIINSHFAAYTLGQQGRWISVEDRLPDLQGRYLICRNHDSIDQCGYIFNGEKWQWNDPPYLAMQITHWMDLKTIPLPTRPKQL